jgi:nitrogen fixation protein FixH
MPNATATARPPRVLTGRMVLFCLLAFFGVVFAVNAVMVRVAVSSFSGVETESAYKAGFNFKNDVAAAQAQEDRHWAVDATLRKETVGTMVTITARDAESRPLAGFAATARLSHPTDKRRDEVIDLSEIAPGRHQGRTSAAQGQWDLVIEFRRDAETVFRSKSRVTL